MRFSHTIRVKITCLACFAALTVCSVASAADSELFASGPLRVSQRNPRYFEDGTGRIVYLTGSHTWENLTDSVPVSGSPAQFNYPEYLSFLQRHNHNFIRLWMHEMTASVSEKNEVVGHRDLNPWPRTGPGMALDGKPKFDLTKFDSAFFRCLRERVQAAGEQGIYVSVMLFEGHSMHSDPVPWKWDGHPLNVKNNVNGINGDPDGKGVGFKTHTLELPKVLAIQETYVRKVIDTVNDLDNVLYEISNEDGKHSTEWQYHMIRLIHAYEKTKPKQHPVGMTCAWWNNQAQCNKQLFESPAEWISPFHTPEPWKEDPPAADGRKVILLDADHLWGVGGDVAWVWKSFCRGHQPIFMDTYSRPADSARTVDPTWDAVRKTMGYARHYAERLNLAKAVPCGDLASTKYCLSDKKTQFLVLLTEGSGVSVDLSTASGFFNAEWLNPNTGAVTPVGRVAGGKRLDMTCPFAGQAVLYLWSAP